MGTIKRIGLKVSPDRRAGYVRAVSSENTPLRLIDFGIIRLDYRESLILPTAGKEVVLTLVCGRCVIEGMGSKLTIGPRKNIFDEQPWAVYARGIDRLSFTARSRIEILVSGAPAKDSDPMFREILPSDVIEKVVGCETYERRVRTIVGEDFPAKRLLVGETINSPGKWSSYPPHRHEKDAPPEEVKLEEVYFYHLEKPESFGLQRIYTDDGRIDEAHVVRDGDVCLIPRGYHPVAATPNSRLYYFWALAGKTRKMHIYTDPDFL
jgi:5-deoxy-glucuronate isomerase